MTAFFARPSGSMFAHRRAEACKGERGNLAPLDRLSPPSEHHVFMVSSWCHVAIEIIELGPGRLVTRYRLTSSPPADRHGIHGGLVGAGAV